ncbi:Holliday junction resolvase RecU [Paenibacillus macerans]|uniref:Holliday junction resolvase RecU n=2 Tax=Paenibacillus macerans TaxID=44252 RepID=A0A6N8EXC8_PAEMA|nr:Holliday junction resolvase RecU [Paenibacillus macerans]
MGFEKLLDYTNEVYDRLGIAVVNKRPTPVKVTKSSGRRVLAGFFEKKSTVDYDGAYRNRRIDFEAKSVESLDRFDLNRVENHQYEHLEKCHKQGSIAFVLIEFVKHRKTYLLPFITLQSYWAEARRGGRKSIRIEELDIHAFEVLSAGVPLDYLDAVNRVWFADVPECFRDLGFTRIPSPDEFDTRLRVLKNRWHPDLLKDGGAALKELQQAAEAAKRYLGGQHS